MVVSERSWLAVFDKSLPRHKLNFGPLVFAIGFVTIGILTLVDASFDEGVAWLWGAALVVLGIAGVATVIDRQRSTDSTTEAEPSDSSGVETSD